MDYLPSYFQQKGHCPKHATTNLNPHNLNNLNNQLMNPNAVYSQHRVADSLNMFNFKNNYSNEGSKIT